MHSVHPVLIMSVTRQTSKFPVVYLIRVALFAGYTAMSPAERELVMTKAGPCPVGGSMARGTVRSHTALMLVIFLVTTIAAHIQLGEMLRLMAVLAGYLNMLPCQRERAQVMIEFSIFPCICRVALAAIGIGYVLMEIDLRSLGLVAVEAIDAAA